MRFRLPDSDIEIELVRIPGGRFRMGSPLDEAGRFDDEGPAHEVTVPTLWLGRFEVTTRQFRAFRPENDPPALAGHAFNAPDQPAVYVSWHDAGHVIRGGSWTTGLPRLRFAARSHAGSNDRHRRIGFRLCMTE